MKNIRKVTVFFLALLIVCCAVFVPNTIKVDALTTRHGYMIDDEVNIRSGPGISNESIGLLYKNTKLLITGEDFDSDNFTWYKVTAYLSSGNLQGYVRSDFVKVTGSDTNYSATVNSTAIVKSAPGSWNDSVVTLNKGQKVTVIGSERDYEKDRWYQVKFILDGSEYYGYIYETRLDIEYVYEEDGDFEAYLNSQGFPESYKPYLRKLHAIHPQWVFIADKIDMTWNEFVAGETVVGRNTVSSSSSEAWRSMELNAYTWGNSTYKVWDTGGWVAAAPSVVKYYIDPRNFLVENDIFLFISMDYDKLYHTREAVDAAVKGTFMEGEFPESTHETYTDVLLEAAEKTKVSPISLAAMIIVEQGASGKGNSISGKVSGYEGYYNFYNIRAYASGDYSAVQYGLLYAKGSKDYQRPWNTRAKSIIGGAEFYADNYVAEGQNTLYYKKFNVVKQPYFKHQYMTNISGALSEARRSAGGYSYVLDSPLKFVIPVYKDMPEELMPYPTKTGNNDCYLTKLSVSGYTSTPSFGRYVNEYEYIVDSSTDTIDIKCTLSNSKATLEGGGKVQLDYGNNYFDIKVTATSGMENIYKVTVHRPLGTGKAEPTLSQDVYKVQDEYISGVEEKTNYSVFLTNLGVKNGTVKVTTADDVSKNAGNMCTGDKVLIYDSDNKLVYTYNVVIKGDINGDGKVSLIDLAKAQRHSILLDNYDGAFLKAIDMSDDGQVSLIDIAKIQRRLIGLE